MFLIAYDTSFLNRIKGVIDGDLESNVGSMSSVETVMKKVIG